MAGVSDISQAAVSRVFSPGPGITRETRQKVLDAVGELSDASNTIAVSVIDQKI